MGSGTSYARFVATGADDVEIVTLRLGFDRFNAHIVTEACRDEGLTVELLTMDDQGSLPGNLAVLRHRLLVRADELDEVRQVLARSGDDAESPDASSNQD